MVRERLTKKEVGLELTRSGCWTSLGHSGPETEKKHHSGWAESRWLLSARSEGQSGRMRPSSGGHQPHN